MDAPLLAIDVGNSRIKFGLFDLREIERGATGLPECRRFTYVSIAEAPPDETLSTWIADRDGLIPAIATGSRPERIERLCREWNHPRIARPVALSDRGILTLRYDVRHPEQVGIDRLLGAVAARRLAPPGTGAVIVDSGTATTVDLVDADGTFRGGAILPGLALSARALHEYTQLLPEIPLAELDAEAKGPVGRDTREAIRSGLYWGHLGAIRELTAHYTALVPGAVLLLTGGGGRLLARQLPEFTLVPGLALQGFALLAPRLLASASS